ncbi:MAG TPA: HDOD domain-containing protein [Opitutus sp.]|nr:HDOD domain-containing protein [Opitutus sp.]
MPLMLPFFKPTPEALVRRLTDLPPAPKVLQRLQRMLVAPNTLVEQLAELVALEPGLSARVVKMANSVHFGRGEPADTIFEAIQRVGLDGVYELVTYAVSSQLVGRPLVSYGLDAQTLWSRAVACGIAAGSLAEHCDADCSEAYTAGLMHGLGLVVIDRHAARERKPHVFPSSGYPQDFAPAERDWIGFSHAEAGAALLEMWGFSQTVAMAVRHQIAPEGAPLEHRQMSMILATARWARSLFCVPEEKLPELPSDAWLKEAGVEINDFGWWLSRVRIRFQIACDELRLD